MGPVILNILIGGGCALLGVVFSALLPTHAFFNRLFNQIEASKRLVGTVWDSSWEKASESGPVYHEELTFTRQLGDKVWAQATRREEPQKLWECEGRYDGKYLQLYYWPSPRSQDPNFLDYGCYFLVRQGDGRMKGYSSGHGPDEKSQEDTLDSDKHLLVRVKPPSGNSLPLLKTAASNALPSPV